METQLSTTGVDWGGAEVQTWGGEVSKEHVTSKNVNNVERSVHGSWYCNKNKIWQFKIRKKEYCMHMHTHDTTGAFTINLILEIFIQG